MDTVNKVVTAASTAIWGENDPRAQQSVQQHGEEPLSGVQGKGVTNDPYDAGNREEQPNAPSTDVNTASQHPTVDGEPKHASSETASGSAKSTNDTAHGVSEVSNSNTSTEASKPSTNASNSSDKKSTDSAEQRSTTQTEGGGASSTGGSSAHGAPSEEALKGPQGPAPHSAEEFEKEAKWRKPAKKEGPAKSSESNSSPSKSSEKSEQGSANASGSGGSEKSGGSGNEKHSAMSKVKERLNKVAHPRHGNKT
ncbi:hypothetical protein N7492_010577 [Penicillium capsulatum]|uniref:Uncharacterized protein n=1 Tax=Penicillium capsulatum TaxID=69766 RepID=A0A9W9HMP8_9EURO|nr:hypothetical protein N7492_010577 [Penicillium capsulatum]KAJ6113077.1 hypothetical protein N7512_008401 [Penicillium capsulatum]